MALLAESFDETTINQYLTGNICRCTGYASIKQAAKILSKLLPQPASPGSKRMSQLIDNSILPHFFLDIANRIQEMPHHNYKTEIFDPAFSKIYGRVMENRQESDYELEAPMTRQDVVEDLNDAEKFVAAVEEWITREKWL